MPEKSFSLSRRSLLAAAGLSALGSSTAVAQLESSTDSKPVESVAADDVVRDESGWPQPGYDSGRSDYSTASAPTTDVEVAWDRDGFEWPFLVADGRIYYSDQSSETPTTVHAINTEDGSDVWSVELAGDSSSRALGRYAGAVVDGTVFYCTYDRTVALDAEDGSELWAADVGGMALNVTADSVVVANTNGELAVLSRDDASVRWRREMDVTLGFAVVDDVAYVATDGREESMVAALRVDDGSEVWTRSFDSEYGFVAATDDSVYYWRSNEFRTLDAETGERRWMKEGGPLDTISGEVENVALHAVGEGVVYATIDEEFGAYDAETGDAQWTMEPSPSTSGWTVAGDAMYTTSYNGTDEMETVVVRSLDGDVVAEHDVEAARGKVIPTADALYVTTASYDDRLITLRDPTDEEESDGAEDGGVGDDGSSDDESTSDGSDDTESDSDAPESDEGSDGSPETPDADDDC